MKNKGFYIKSLVATGPNVVDARIDFAKGCNLIFGKSDTGKSHIIRKTKCSRAIKRSVSFYKTKRIPIHTIYKH